MNITEDVHGIWVYADGRLIWRRSLDSHITPEARRHGFGASEPTRAVIEQRLRPEGVELLRSEVIRAGLAGLVEPDSECGGPPYWPPYWAQLAVRVGDQLMSGEWCAPGLAGHLADFASWLPASAWAEQRIGAYVPLWYAVCIAPSEEQAQVVDQLPGSIRRLLRSYAPPRIWPDGNPDACSYQVTTDEARAIAAMLDDAGLERSFFDSHRSRLGYTFPLDQGAIDGWSGDGWFLLVPMLPNGEPVEYDQ